MYGHAALTETELAECRDLHRQQKEAIRAFKTARYARLQLMADAKAFREKHGLSVSMFNKYGTGINGKRPLPDKPQWTCKCGWENHGRACEECGRLKP